jgi:hypothetical protein
MESSCTIKYNNPYWIGIFERNDELGYSVAQHIFGSEPGDAEIYDFIRHGYRSLLFSKPVAVKDDAVKVINFKRRQREIRRTVEEISRATRAQEALKAEFERRKEASKIVSRSERELDERVKFIKRQEKKKEKKRGH